MSDLAILGGTPVRSGLWPGYRTVGAEEARAVQDVIASGVLSGYQGVWNHGFLGGPRVRALEQAWAEAFGTRHAVAVNSATSGLYAAVAAMGVEPGDEVIVPPYTMSASVMAPLLYGAIPVFADIDPGTFCLDPEAVRAAVTPRTRGLVVVHLFGHPADMDELRAIAATHGLWIVEDCAQAPGATLHGRAVGSFGNAGVFSLNRHKHIQTGEGGVVVTDDDAVALRVQLVRNHAEAVVGEMGTGDVANMLGFNFRMTELEAAVACEQLAKLPGLVEARIENAGYLAERIGALPGFVPPEVRPGARHVYYFQAFRYDQSVVRISRDLFVRAVAAELPPVELQEQDGPLISAGYVPPLYLLPVFQKRLAFGSRGYPFALVEPDRLRYGPGTCPVAERMHARELLTHEYMRPPATRSDLDDVASAFEKVYEHRDRLAAALGEGGVSRADG